jgi:putative heme transporter
MSRLVKNTRTRISQVTLPAGLVIATEWSWRFLIIAAALTVLIILIGQLSFIVIPLLIALLLSALITPLSYWLRKNKFPNWLATITSILVLLGTFVSLIWIVVTQTVRSWDSFQARSLLAYENFVQFLLESRLEVSEEQIQSWFDDLAGDIEVSRILSGALSIGSSLGTLLIGLTLSIFALIFFVHDGEKIWKFIIRLMPKDARAAIDGAGITGWRTFTTFVKVQVLVAFIDAVGIGLGALILGLPLVLPIAVIVFLGGFVPIVGAFVTGAIAVFIALVYEGFTTALIMLIIVIAVQQLEGQILQPFIMGRAVRIHPLAVVLVVTAGGFLAGITGALFAVPLLALFNVAVRYIASGAWKTTKLDV